MRFRDSVAALRASWWLSLLGLVLGGLIAGGVSYLSAPLYTSHIQFFVSTTDSTTPQAVLQGSQFSQQRVSSYAQLIQGEQLARRVIDQLGLQISPSQLASEISVEAVPTTVLLNVDVSDPSPRRAQSIAGAIGDQFPEMVRGLETPDSGATSPVKVTVVEGPDRPVRPSSPHTTRDLILGLVIGTLVGGLIAITRARLDRSVKDPAHAAQLGGAPLIGTVLRDEALEKNHTFDRTGGGRTAEDYRQLRNNLQFLKVDEPPKVIMVSSALPGEGKTTLAINLGISLTEAGQRVVLVEADLRQPKVSRYLGMVGGVGLTNVLVGNVELDEVLQTYRDGLSVIAAGPTPPNPGELLASSHMATVIEKLRGQNDFVLIDAPPLLPVADSSGLAVHADGVLLSVRYGSTHKDQLHQASATLERVGATTLGVVLNIVPPKAELASAYGYGYNYGYAKPKHVKD